LTVEVSRLTATVTTAVTAPFQAMWVLGGAGVVRPYHPVALARAGWTLARWGLGPAGGFSAQAALAPERTALVDELGELTFRDLHLRSNSLAASLRTRGVGEGDAVAVMCRNHRGFVDVSLAAAKLGADLLYLNTAFAGPQLAEVLGREKPALVVLDEEFVGMLAGAPTVDRVLAWTDGAASGAVTLEDLIAHGDAADPAPPGRHSRTVILTSGTTGTPKGAPRGNPGLEAAAALLSRLPLRARWRCHIAAPLFHTWGFAHLELAMLLGTTMVLRRSFDPEGALRAVSEQRCDSMVVIPVMLQRILELPRETLDSYDLSGVRAVAASGSALPGDLGARWMDRFGDTLYNIYGSTEVAYATVAGPDDLRAAPRTAGRPPYATVVKILDPDGRELPAGETGRIFVGNSVLFEGYTGGGSREVVAGLMCTGDVGRFDESGRLFVEGRDDEMIVSGGENVFPQEVEDLLAAHEKVVEAAVIGVDDEQFGARVRAFVVPSAPDALTEDDVKGYVRQNLARYKVPREVVFLDRLPRNATGKVLKRELLEHDLEAR
jgi:fatty-acyl-CoA synthase